MRSGGGREAVWYELRPNFPCGTNANRLVHARDVDENSPPGTNVGDPVKASDSPGEILTYQ